MGIDATFSPRNDILFQGKKISGNAQFTNRKNILSHGTLLFQANLEQLRLALKPNAFAVETKAVSSVRSPVMNLSEVYATFF
jgi:lipoate-protein ligase A